MTTTLRLFAIAAVVGWSILFFSSFAILIGGQKIEPIQAAPYLECRYFTGTGFVETTYWYADNGIFGRAACPRSDQQEPAEVGRVLGKQTLPPPAAPATTYR